MAINITLGDIELKDVSSIHAFSSGRVIINKNFQKIKANLDILSAIPVENLNKLNFPDTPQANTDYVLNWDNNQYNIIPATFKNTGTKWKIELGEEIHVGSGHQYIVHDRIDIEGVLDLEGQLVII